MTVGRHEEAYATPDTSHEPAPPRKLDPWPLRGRAFAEIIAAYVALVLIGLGLGWLILYLLAETSLTTLDGDLSAWFESIRTAQWNDLTNIGSAFANTFNIIAALLVLMFTFTWVWRRWRQSLTLGVALVLEATVFLTVSHLIGRDRPPVVQLDASPPTASFPSGHTGAAFAFYISLAVIVFWNTKNPIARFLAVVGAIFFPLSVAGSRLYRGMHYLTDVMVGALLGVLCLVIAIWIVQRAIQRIESRASRT
jgi:undecaprenyl-diphosphatase